MTKCKTSKGKTKITIEETDQENCHTKERMNMGGNPGGESLEKAATDRGSCLLEDPYKNEQNRPSSEAVRPKWAQFPTCCGK